MKKDYKFNPQEPSSEVIQKYKDFDALLNKMETSTPPKVVKKEAKRIGIRSWSYGIAAAAVLAGVFFFVQNIRNSTEQDNYQQLADTFYQTRTIGKNPTSIAQPLLTSKTFDTNTASRVVLNKNCVVNIPAAAFTDEAGNSIQGKVRLKYKQLHNEAEYFLAGVPMQHSKDIRHESILELYAEQDGKTVNIAPNKEIEIIVTNKELIASDMTTPKSRATFMLNEQTQIWENLGFSQSQFMDELTTRSASVASDNIERKYAQKIELAKQSYLQRKAELETTPTQTSLPQKPQAYNPKKTVFDLQADFDVAGIPSDAKNLKWQIEGDESQVNIISKTEWFEDEIELQKVGERVYKMVFDNGDLRIEVNATPVLSGAEYQAALKKYEMKVKSIQASHQQKLALQKTQLDELNLAFRTEMQQLLQEKENKIQAQKTSQQQSTTQLVERTVKHIFTIKKCGIWSIGEQVDNEIESYHIECISPSGELLTQNTSLYHIDMTNRVLTEHYIHAAKAKIFMNKNHKHKFWIVDNNGSVLLGTTETSNDNTLKVILSAPQVVTSGRDVYKVLGLGMPF